jgi:purine catabolism regulator
MQNDFMDELLAGRLTRQEALYRAQRLQLDQRAPHISLVLAWQKKTGLSSQRLEALVRQVVASHRTLARILLRGERVLILLAAPEVDPIDYAFDLARSVALEAARQYPDVELSIGIGRLVKEIGEWPASYRDAAWACTVAQRLASSTPLFFGDLGVYRLLAQLEGGQELQAFCETVLGSLMAYDRQHNAELIETLETYFVCQGNASQTAQRLHIHRNTLLYRLARIAELSTIDLENEESRLAAHVALKVRRLLSSGE